MKRPLIIALLIGICIILLFITFLPTLHLDKKLAQFIPSEKKTTPVAKNILDITDPIKTFSGTVESIQGNMLTVTKEGQNKISFIVFVSPETQLSKQTPFIPYVLITITPSAPSPITIQDIKVGDTVTATAHNDLRTKEKNEIHATHILVSAGQTNILGKVTDVREKEFNLVAKLPNEKEEKTYTVQINDQTEISRIKPDASLAHQPEYERVPFSDIVEGTQVNVFTNQNILYTSTLLALRIKPFQSSNENVASASVSLVPTK